MQRKHEFSRGSSLGSAGASALVFSLALAAACGGDPASTDVGDLTISVDTVDGVIRVTNTGTAPEWRLTQVISIGPKSLTDTGSPEEFGNVTSVSLGPDEAVFVADRMNDEVRVFGLDGVHRRTFGRDGEGPGEFGSLYSLAWVGDRLLTLDPRVGRIGEFSAQGDWLGQRNAAGGFSGSVDLIRLHTVGADETYATALVTVGTGSEVVLLGHDSRGETGDTLQFVRAEAPPGPAPMVICEFDGGTHFFPVPFALSVVRHPGPGGVWYSAWNNSYRITVTGSGADTLRVIERSLPTEPVTDEEWAAVEQAFDDSLASYPNPSCDPRRPGRPAVKPVIEELLVAPDGKLWVKIVRAAGNRWEFFDPEGRLLGTVPAPEQREGRVPAFGPDLLVTIRQDSLALDHVDVWRIEPSGR